jgi:invasion protein IalB
MKQLAKGRTRKALAVLLLTAFGQAGAQAAVKSGDHFGDWVAECPTVSGKAVCLLSQTLVTTKDKQRIARFTVRKDIKPGSALFTALLPLGIYLPAGAQLTLTASSKDSAHAIPLTLRACTKDGCFANALVDNALLKGAKADGKLDIAFTLRPDAKPAVFQGSLKGLAEGMAALPD